MGPGNEVGIGSVLSDYLTHANTSSANEGPPSKTPPRTINHSLRK